MNHEIVIDESVKTIALIRKILAKRGELKPSTIRGCCLIYCQLQLHSGRGDLYRTMLWERVTTLIKRKRIDFKK